MSKEQFYTAKFKSESSGDLSEQFFVGSDASEVMEIINEYCIEEGKLLLDVFIVASPFHESSVVEFNPKLRVSDLDMDENEKEAIHTMMEDLVDDIEEYSEYRASFTAANDE